MQEDFKNQLQNALAQWRKRGQEVWGQVVAEVRGEIRNRLSQQGIAERWPSVVNLIEEIAPELAPTVAGIISRKLDPIAEWLETSVKNWEPYKLELAVSPKPHLLEGGDVWKVSSIVAMAELAGRWILERHIPPGELKVRILRLELESLAAIDGNCTVRCELDPMEFEGTIAQILKKREAEIVLPTMIFNSADALSSQVNFHFELKWAPLLK